MSTKQRVIEAWENLKYHIEEQTDINVEVFDSMVKALTEEQPKCMCGMTDCRICYPPCPKCGGE